MDVKTAFLNSDLKEEVYISQLEGFVDQDNPSHVYKLKKALYGLKQVPRAWYGMLSSFLISQHFSKGAVDLTLFTRHVGNDLLLVQIYVDDIIFTSTNTAMCNEFANQMTTKFKMSMMGKMSFFLVLQISQSPKGIFINQSKYASEIVKKYGLLTTDSFDTPLLTDYGFQFNKIPLYCDNKSVIALCCNNVQHSRAKHIDVCYQFIKEQVENGINHVFHYCSTSQTCPGTWIPRRKDLRLGNATEDSILERYKENPHFKSLWMLLFSLHATLHFSSLDVFKICPRVHGQDFDALPTDEEIVSFLRDFGHTGEIHSLNHVMHQPWRTFAALINRSLSGKTSGLDKLRLSKAQILWGMYHQKNVDYVELLWEDFIYQINNRAYKKQEKIYHPRFTKVIIHYFLTQDKTVSCRNKIRMHTSRDDYLINTLRFVSIKEETQIYGAILSKSLTSPEMKETKPYKTYLGFATGVTPPKKAQKFKKPVSPKLTTIPVSTEEPIGKSKRVKRPTKKSTKAPARGVVIRETPEMPLSKKKEKVDVTRGKGIELLSEVALAKDAQFEEVQRKSIMDFHKTHPSGSGTITKTASSAEIIPSVTNEGTGVKPGVPDVMEDESSESEAESEEMMKMTAKMTMTPEVKEVIKKETNENEEDIGDDEEEMKDKFVKTPSKDSDNEDEIKITDKAEGDEDEEIDYINQVTTLENNPLHTQVKTLVDDHLDARLGATRDEFMNHLSSSITARVTKQVKIQLPQFCKKRVHKFASPTSKDAEPTKGPKAKESHSSSSKGDNSQHKSSGKFIQSEEPEFEVADSDMP
ncbi:retrovirus-related pol polyprotein from transposon TNT 1-94 [Tanacetum coccineum]